MPPDAKRERTPEDVGLCVNSRKSYHKTRISIDNAGNAGFFLYPTEFLSKGTQVLDREMKWIFRHFFSLLGCIYLRRQHARGGKERKGIRFSIQNPR